MSFSALDLGSYGGAIEMYLLLIFVKSIVRCSVNMVLASCFLSVLVFDHVQSAYER